MFFVFASAIMNNSLFKDESTIKLTAIEVFIVYKLGSDVEQLKH